MELEGWIPTPGFTAGSALETRVLALRLPTGTSWSPNSPAYPGPAWDPLGPKGGRRRSRAGIPPGCMSGWRSRPALPAHIRERCLRGSRKWPRVRGKRFPRPEVQASLVRQEGQLPGLGARGNLGVAFGPGWLRPQLGRTEVSEQGWGGAPARSSACVQRGSMGVICALVRAPSTVPTGVPACPCV